MTNEECEVLALQMKVQPEIEVELRDEYAHGASHDPQLASEGAERRASAIANGERTYHVFHNGREVRSGLVDRDQVQRLIRAGAVWTGPEHNRPANAIASPAYLDALAARSRALNEHVELHTVEVDGVERIEVLVGLATMIEGGAPPPRVSGGPITNAEARALIRAGLNPPIVVR
jgi:hypothetical protein